MPVRSPDRWLALSLGVALAAPWSASAQCPEAAKLMASDAAVDDRFGWSVAVDGDVAVVGAYGKDQQVGAAYIYRFDPGTSQWIEEAILPPELGGHASFGRSVAAGGDVVLVGAPAVAGGGGVYVYRYDPGSGQWLEGAILEASDGQDGDQFGWSVDLDGDVAIVATYGPGTAYVYRFDAGGGQWFEEARLMASDGAPLRESVSICGDVVVAGTRTGWSCAYVFRYAPDGPAASGSPWVEQARLAPWDSDYLDYYGNAVAVSGDRLIVGAGGDIPTFDPGAAYVYRYDPSAAQWVPDGKLLAADGSRSDHYGYAVAIHGDAAVVGELYDQAGDTDAGSAYVYRRQPGGWFEQDRIVPSDAEDGDQFGRSVALGGDVALVGASEWLQEDGTGSAYVFNVSATDCNNNGVTDACEILDGTAPDQDGNGRPDECDDDPGQYVGPDGGSWFEPSHWNGGSVPDQAVHATVPAHVVIDQPGAQAATVTLTSSGGLDFISGSLVSGGVAVTPGGVVEGTGTIQGAVVNAGAVDPGVLVVDGDYAQTAEGILRIELGASGSSPAQDLLAVSGGAALDGTLILRLLEPHEALFGETFEIVTCGDCSGWFKATDPPVLPAPLGWNIEIMPAAIQVDFSAATCGVQKVVPPDAVAQDRFGSSIAVSGDIAVVGGDQGIPPWVLRYEPQSSRWLYEASLEPSDGASLNGDAVAVSEGSVIAGGLEAAYVFTYDPQAATWVEQDKLTASDGVEHDSFGAFVAIDGNRALIGAPGAGDAGFDAGAAYVFEREPGTSHWVERVKLLPSVGVYRGLFGDCLALEGDLAVVGAPGPVYGGQAGSAHVFRHDPGSSQWTEEARLQPSTSFVTDFFGSVLCIEGETIIAGQPAYWYPPPDGHAVFLFRHDPDRAAWVEAGRLDSPDAAYNDGFGRSVAANGDVLVVGAPWLTVVEDWAGAVHVYRFDPVAATASWRTKVVPADPAQGGAVGEAVAVVGTTLLAGGQSAGAAYVFDIGGPCPGDVDGDGQVGVEDFLDLLAAWGPCPAPPEPCPADFDGDGVVGVVDFLALLAHWG